MKCKTLFLCLLLLMAGGQAMAQYSANLQKYWWYHYRLVNDYMKIGTNCGESITASIRHKKGENNSLTGPHLHWGDATIMHGHLLCMLAAEYQLLSQNSLATDRTVYELYHALAAFDRLDRNAEEYCRNFPDPSTCREVHPHNGSDILHNDFNGFFIRDDATRDFVEGNQENLLHFNRPGICNRVSDLTSDMVQRTDRMLNPDSWAGIHSNVPRYPVEMSQDQFIEIYKGLALVIHLLPGNVQYNGISLKFMAQDALLRMCVWASSIGTWRLVNPLTLQCVYGVETNQYMQLNGCAAAGADMILIGPGVAGGLPNIGAQWSGQDAVKIAAINVSAAGAIPLWHLSSYLSLAGCSGDGNLFQATIAACGNTWTFTRQKVNKQSYACNLRFPHLPLIYRILHGGPLFRPNHYLPWPFHNIDGYETRFDYAPACGIYNYNGTWGHEEWSSYDRLSEAKKRNGADGGEGDYSGVDYMALFNLYLLNKGDYASFFNNPYYRENLSQIYPYTLNGTTYGNAQRPTYLKYLQYLSTTSHVTPPGRVTYRCGQQIKLLPGFQADAGSNFKAFIKDYKCCNRPDDDPFQNLVSLDSNGTNPNTMEPFEMDTVEDVVPFVPFPIPTDTTADTLDATPDELSADSLYWYNQLMASGDSDMIRRYEEMVVAYNEANSGGGSGNKTNHTTAAADLAVFPNPNDGSFNIVLPGKPEQGTYAIQVINMYGRLIYETAATGGTYHVLLDQAPPGNYLIRVRSGTRLYMKRITIVH